MGDYRITIEAVGNHGCGRNANDGDVVTRCGQDNCPDCKAIAFMKELKRTGENVKVATLEHWPAAGKGPTDDLITGVRSGKF